MKDGRIGIVSLALVVLIGGSAWLYAQQRIVQERARAEGLLAERATVSAADVAKAARVLKLVTVQIATRVKVERGDESWRGDVKASVDVPVRLHYGTDLEKLDVSRVAVSRVLGTRLGALDGYLVTIDPPERIATEVLSEKERAEVEAGGLRLRSRAGEYYLGLARKDAGEAARELVLLPEDAEKVERATREQVEELVRAIVGEDAGVIVRVRK